MRIAGLFPTLEETAPPTPSAPGAHVLQLRAHRSLTRRSAWHFIACVAVGTFGVALYFTAYGFWPVLVFAALEIAALIWAVHCSMRSGLISETITVTQNEISIAHRERAHERLAVFPRHWAKVTLHAPPGTLRHSRLLLESHGRACEVGRFLNDDERRTLAIRLKQLVGNVNESPAL